MTKKHEAKLETRLKALTAFYAQLNPAQQTLFDEHSFGGERGGCAPAAPRGHGAAGATSEGWGGRAHG
jgi:hypothetical protein